MILLRKAVRTIWRGKRSYIACVALLALGVMIYISMNLMHLNMDASVNAMYREQRFADGFARVREMPLTAAALIEQESGIARMQSGLTSDARVQELGGAGEIITLRIASYNPDDTEALNKFILMRGTEPSEGEILVGDPFFEANGLEIGDTLTFVLGGRLHSLTISGTVLSPEYIYSIPDASQLLPDNRTFGFAFLPYRQLAPMLGMDGMANTLAFTFEYGWDFDLLQPTLEDTLRPYGLVFLIGREDHPSHALVSMQIDSIGGMAGGLSMVFVGMAVIILYIMLGRVIQQERMQIGALKAFGFSNRTILGHYLCYGMVIGFVGGTIGVITGLAAADSMTDLFLEYFHLPGLRTSISPSIPITGFLIAIISGALGAFMGVRKILKLLPCEAMRPSAPKSVKSDALKAIGPLRYALSGGGLMAVRNITRSRFRSLFVILGISFSFSLMAMMGSYEHMFNVMMTDQFEQVQVFDLQIVLDQPRSYTEALEAAWRIDTVSHAEVILEIPVELRHNHLRRGAVITALPQNGELYRIFDNSTRQVHPPPTQGFIISQSLADHLEAQRGDMLTFRTAFTGTREHAAPVIDVISGSSGLAAYIELHSLSSLLDISPSVSSILLNADDTGAIKESLIDGENVSALIDARAALQAYSDYMEAYISMMFMMLFAAMGVAFAIISNTSSISLAERSREYSTMRVLGMSPREIGRVLAFEYRILTIAGIAIGIPLTNVLKEAVYGSMSNDMFTIPTDTPMASLLLAGAMCIFTVELCSLLSARRIAKFNMVEVLKERE